MSSPRPLSSCLCSPAASWDSGPPCWCRKSKSHSRSAAVHSSCWWSSPVRSADTWRRSCPEEATPSPSDHWLPVRWWHALNRCFRAWSCGQVSSDGRCSRASRSSSTQPIWSASIAIVGCDHGSAPDSSQSLLACWWFNRCRTCTVPQVKSLDRGLHQFAQRSCL